MTEHVAEIRSRCVVNDACLAEHGNASAGSPKTSPEVFSSAIEFYVWSDEGINLYVDLNSSPLDWTERLKNEVYICESVYREECLHQNLCWFKGHKGIASSFQWNSPAGLIKDDYLRKENSSSLDLMINKCTEIDQLDEADGSVISSAVMSHAINADASEHLDEDQTIMSSGIDFDVQNQKLAGSEFCAAVDNCEKNINDALQKKANCDSVSGGLSSAATLEHRNSILESEICETSTLQNSCTILNLSVGYPGSSAAGSMDVQSSDIEERPKDISCTPYGGFSQRDSKNVTDYSLRTFAEKSVRCCFVANFPAAIRISTSWLLCFFFSTIFNLCMIINMDEALDLVGF